MKEPRHLYRPYTFMTRLEKEKKMAVDEQGKVCYNNHRGFMKPSAGLAQLVERLIRNHEVVGSNPTFSSKNPCNHDGCRDSSFAVLRQPDGAVHNIGWN
jgi:hypothetical protein